MSTLVALCVAFHSEKSWRTIIIIRYYD